ncbi:MAG: 2Fe-2S iron-sulfur cluster binding domain-containing protein [Xanthomonadales bacterium]|nr:CDP-6-deoxy-L-threo-D-glycero-4-hexulose-3-dehydrase reductase [Xanthomonadales bacterium]MCC6594177.1 2Fe-2S iron-sulfur cluster binding domain-containing protein [Xanthomonadales bacterium]MCE7931667.1 NAD(P)H-flavin reductase [Xanthomonadales bacterium PRO6]
MSTPARHHVQLAGSGKAFDVEAGETVLAAARRAGLALPYSCLSGSCGSCKGRLVAGEVVYPYNPPDALSADERAHGQALLCQAVPRSDLTLAIREVDAVAGIPIRQLAAKVVGLNRLCADVMELKLLPPPREAFNYLPGQYLDILLPEGRRRAFSIANPPQHGQTLDLHVRRVAGGGFTQFVFDELQLGQVLRIEAPLGTFVPREGGDRPIVLMAGGTGFAPIKAIVEHLLDRHTHRALHVYWGARHVSDLYLDALCRNWQAQHANLRYTPVLSEATSLERNQFRSGPVHEAVLSDFPDLSRFDVYMSGPPPMIDAGRRGFVAAGLPEDRLYYDSFDYAPDVLAALIRARGRGGGTC